jgi:hypothetical protein
MLLSDGLATASAWYGTRELPVDMADMIADGIILMKSRSPIMA